MSFIDYTDRAIMKILVDQILQLNPWLKLGEQLTGPVATVCEGKIVDVDAAQAAPANLIRGIKVPASIQPVQQKWQSLTTETVKFSLSDIENFRRAAYDKVDFKLSKPTYIHPYLIMIPAREWLEKYNVGDKVAVETVDPATFQTHYVETTLTQQMIDENSEVIFRFALSD